MSRLIDTDSFKNFIESLPKNPNGTSRVYDEAAILRFIDAQPTAYDVEKVVAELEEEKTGIVRRVDDLGRILIPKEVRRTLKITDGQPMEVFVDGDSIVLKKCKDSEV